MSRSHRWTRYTLMLMFSELEMFLEGQINCSFFNSSRWCWWVVYSSLLLVLLNPFNYQFFARPHNQIFALQKLSCSFLCIWRDSIKFLCFISMLRFPLIIYLFICRRNFSLDPNLLIFVIFLEMRWIVWPA